MDSNPNSRMSLGTDNASKQQASDHNNNSEQFLRRKVRDNWKELCVTFKHAADKKGVITPEALRHVLYRFDIMPSDEQFQDFCTRMDTDGDGELTYQEFMAFFGKGSESDKQVIGVIRNMSAEQAKMAIRKAVEARLEGGPGGLRRAYKFFDRDGSGGIDIDEFKAALKSYAMLEFEDSLIQEIMADWAPDGVIDYYGFCANVMDDAQVDLGALASNKSPKKKKNSGLPGSPSRRTKTMIGSERVTSMPPSIVQFVRDKIEAKSVQIHEVYRYFDENHDQFVTPIEFKNGLAGLGIQLPSTQFQALVRHVDTDSNGTIDYNEFVSDLKNRDVQTGDMWELGKDRKAKTTDPMVGSVGIGKDNIKDILIYIQQKIETKSGSLTKVFRGFDEDSSGSVDYREFRTGLMKIGVPLNDKEFDMLIAEVDNDGGGEIDYNEFAEDMKENDAQHVDMVKGSERKRGPAASAIEASAAGIGKDNVRDILIYIQQKIESKSGSLTKVFRNFDEDSSGSVDYDEFRKGLLHLGIPLNDKEFDMLIAEVDNDLCGEIDYNEFAEDMKGQDAGHSLVDAGSQKVLMADARKHAHVVPKGIGGAIGQRRDAGGSMPDHVLQFVRDKIEARSLQIHEVYRHFDENHDQFVTPVEFKNGLAGLGIQLPDAQFQAIVQHVDANGNGTIDYDEFVSNLKNGDMQTRPNVVMQMSSAIFEHVREKLAAKRKTVGDLYRNFNENFGTTVSPAELRRGLLKSGVQLSDRQFEEMLQQLAATSAGTYRRSAAVGSGSGDVALEDLFSALKSLDRQSLDAVRSLPELSSRRSSLGRSSMGSRGSVGSRRSSRSRESSYSRQRTRPIMGGDDDFSLLRPLQTPSSRQSSSRRFQALP